MTDKYWITNHYNDINILCQKHIHMLPMKYSKSIKAK